jgi:hypothetical protein
LSDFNDLASNIRVYEPFPELMGVLPDTRALTRPRASVDRLFFADPFNIFWKNENVTKLFGPYYSANTD